MSTKELQDNQKPRGIAWQIGTVVQIVEETYRVKTFTIRLPEWRSFRPGQHYDIRLTAPDGYQAQRSYSIASAPETEGTIDLTVEVIPDGEVSPFFHEVVSIGDEIELRGPIGGPFTWSKSMGGPLLLVGGGSGLVPLMSMVRHKRNSVPEVQALLLYSSRSLEDIIYREELERINMAEPNLTVLNTLTRTQPEGWSSYSRRIDRNMLEEVVSRMNDIPLAYICGPTPFVEAVADALVALDILPERIHTERFGPSG